MADFADFQQVDEGGDLGNFTNAAPANDDPFASAMGGMMMSSQPGDMGADLGAFAAPSVQNTDYTEEEQALIQKVNQENEDRKRQLYEKQVAE